MECKVSAVAAASSNSKTFGTPFFSFRIPPVLFCLFVFCTYYVCMSFSAESDGLHCGMLPIPHPTYYNVVILPVITHFSSFPGSRLYHFYYEALFIPLTPLQAMVRFYLFSCFHVSRYGNQKSRNQLSKFELTKSELQVLV